METINIYAAINSQRVDGSGYASINIKVDVNSNHYGNENIGHKVKLEDWDPVTRTVKPSNPNYVYINSLISNKKNQIQGFIVKRQALGLPITKDVIKQVLKTKSIFPSFYKFAEELIDNKKFKDGTGYSEGTKGRYRTEIKRLKHFSPTLDFHQITVDFLEKYEYWMYNVYLKKDGSKMHKNGIWKALGFVRLIFNEAVSNGEYICDNNPFTKFDVGGYVTDMEKIKFLEINEIDKIERELLKNVNLSETTLAVGWRFLAMCVTGMRISDAKNFDDMFINENNELEYVPHKTRRHQNTARLPLTSPRQARYINETLKRPLPDLQLDSYRKMFNDHLKIIAAAAHITTHITSHVGRHTMGGIIVDAGIEREPAKKILGIKSDKTLEVYKHLKADKLKKEADKLRNII